ALEREGFEEHGIDEGKDRGIGADAESERDQDDGGEGPILGQHPEAEPHVLQQSHTLESLRSFDAESSGLDPSQATIQAMRFECQKGCVTCCQQKGFVYLTEDDIVRAALFLGMPAAEFERKFVYRTTNLRRLRTPRNAQCGFLRPDGCSIHPAK